MTTSNLRRFTLAQRKNPVPERLHGLALTLVERAIAAAKRHGIKMPMLK